MSPRLVVVALLMAAVGCSRDAGNAIDPGAEPADDAGVPLPQLDRARCGTVAADELPLTFDRGLPPATTGVPLADTIFPLFAELDGVAAITSDPQLAELERKDADRFATAASCADAACVAATTAWPEAELSTAAEQTARAIEETPMVVRLRSIGRFNAHADKSARELLLASVLEHLRGARAAIAAFAGELTSAELSAAVAAARPRSSPVAYYDRTRALAVAILGAARRDQATLYEPLDRGENAAAVAAIPGIRWVDYPFSAIIVPGLGPSDADTALAEGGRARADLAAQRFEARLAPLIVLSGGHVHPDRTKYSEAIEMKRYLVERRAIPASAILVDPHARHTTTNLRNTSRLLIRYGVPLDRPALITTDMFQSLYIIGRPFAVRCRNEIGYEPWRKLTSLSVYDACFFPTVRSLHVGPGDPRDP